MTEDQPQARLIWWDWKAHIPMEEIHAAEADGLVWFRMVPYTGTDDWALACFSKPLSLEEAQTAWDNYDFSEGGDLEAEREG
jgi:hypothetical protein